MKQTERPLIIVVNARNSCPIFTISERCPAITIDFLNVSLTSSSQSGTRLAVSCAPTYLQVGGPIRNITCLGSGTWTTFPNCVGTWN